MHRERVTEDRRWENFLKESIAGLSYPSKRYRAKIELITRVNAGLDGKDDASLKLYEVMNWAQSVNTAERASRILSRSELFEQIKVLREQHQADLVIVAGNRFPSRGIASTNEGADDARFFALVDEQGFKSGTTVAHEISHLLGSKHQIYVAPTKPVNAHAAVWWLRPEPTWIQKLDGSEPSTDWQMEGTADAVASRSNEYSTLTRYPRFSGSVDVTACTGDKTKSGMVAWNNVEIIRANLERLVAKREPLVPVASHCPIFDYRDDDNNDIQACPDIDFRGSETFYFKVGKDEYYTPPSGLAEDRSSAEATFTSLLERYENRKGVPRSTVFIVSGFASSESPAVNWHLSYLRARRVASDLNGLIKGARPRIAICPAGDIYAGCFERDSTDGSRRDARRVIVTMNSESE